MQSCGICHIEGSTDGHLIDGWVCHRRTKNEMFNFAIQTLSRSIIAVRSNRIDSADPHSVCHIWRRPKPNFASSMTPSIPLMKP